MTKTEFQEMLVNLMRKGLNTVKLLCWLSNLKRE